MATKKKLLEAAAGASLTPDTGDPEFANVTLLLDGDGTSGDNNNTFTDSSTNGFTVTENGSVIQGSFSPYGDNWSNYFGSGNKLKTAGSSDFAFGTGDFSIECWVNAESFSSTVGLLNTQLTDTTAGAGMWYLAIINSTTLRLGRHGSPQYVDGSTSFSENTWHHIHASRVSSTVRLFVDGVSLTLTNTGGGLDTYDFNSNGTNLTVGFVAASNPLPGYLSNARVIKGTSSENKTSNFTPSTSPLTAVTNTVLLTAQSNRFVDNSSSAHTFSVDGTPKVTPFSPFKNDDARDITTDGGSAYFNYGPYLTLPQNTAFNFGTGDFTVEFWANVDTYRTSGSYFDAFVTFGFYTSSPYFRMGQDGKFKAGLVGIELSSTTVLKKSEWNHLAVTRSGATVNLFVNGALEATNTHSASLGNSAAVTIGTSSWQANNEEMKGYLSDVRIVKGAAVYTSSFTPPTAPLTAVTNTSALLNFQDAGIYDLSGINNLDTVGDARLGFAPIYGTGSLEFDGSGDYLKIPQNDDLELGSGDYTIECWVNISAAASVGGIFSKGLPSTLNTSTWSLEFNTTNNYVSWYVQAASTSYIITGSQNIKTSKWIHIAVTRSGNDTKLFVNGVQDGSTYTGGYTIATGGDLYLGTGFYDPTTRTITGYIDDFRITKGVARYTSNFTPPTEIDLALDTHAEYVTLFLDGDGPANGQNNTFTDSSTNDFTITESGSVVQGVFSPYGDNWSNYFNGTDYLYGTVNALGTGDFTLECWVNFSSLGANRTIMSFGAFSPGLYYRHASTELAVYHGGAFYLSGFTPEVGEWYHVAFTRSGTTSRMFVNGTQQGSDTTYSTNITDTTLRIGYDSVDYTDAYISNVRVVKGTALYTSNFTAPTSPLSAVTNTELLTCQSNRFVDNGSNSITVSVNSTPQVTRFSPFESNKPYDITTDGGSGDFSNSALTLADSTSFDFGTGDFTMEAWIYPRSLNDANDYNSIVSAHNPTAGSPAAQDSWLFTVLNNQKLTVYGSGGTTSSSNATVSLNEWSHVMITRSSGTIRFFINGTLDTNTPSVTGNFNCTSAGLAIGRQANPDGSTTRYWDGWISNVRLVKGTALQTSSFTPPTSPLTAVTNTELLLNFQDSAIPDLSGLNNIDTVGNAKVAASDPTKYGSNAMQFDGSGDLRINVTDPISFSGYAGDFTAEMWVYPTAVGSSNSYVWQHAPSATSYSPFIIVMRPSTYEFAIYASSNGSSWNLISNATIGTATANAWNHIAVVRDGTNIKAYMNGTVGSTSAVSTTALMTTSGQICIGSALGTANTYFTGFIDDLRITKGIARYTSNFTPPSAALPKF